MKHPNATIASSGWSEDQTLHVVSCYSNPFRWDSRRKIANDFIRQMASNPNVQLTMVELAYGDRPFELDGDCHNLRLRTGEALWHKENLLNIGLQHVVGVWPTFKYGMICDADMHFTRYDWALETIHQLQMYDWVQPYSTLTYLSGHDLGRGHRPVGHTSSFVHQWFKRGHKPPSGYDDCGWRVPYSGLYGPAGVGSPGGAWAFRRSAFDMVGGLMDRCILGSADWFMAFGLIGKQGMFKGTSNYTSQYYEYIRAWQDNAASVRQNIGYVDCHAIHHFHGKRSRRGYSTRDRILVDNQYNPISDIRLDIQGVISLRPDRIKLRDDVRSYFLSRGEDYQEDS